MIITGRYYYENAICIRKDMLEELDELIKEEFGEPEYTATLYSEDEVKIQDINELLKIDNFDNMKIVSMVVMVGDDFWLNMKPIRGVIKDFECTVSLEYITDDVNKSEVFKSKVNHILEKGKFGKVYNFIAKISVGIMLIIIGIILLHYGVYQCFFSGKTNKIQMPPYMYIECILSSLFFASSTYILLKLLKSLFPALVFSFEEERYKEIQRAATRNSIFWSGVVAVVIAAAFWGLDKIL